MSPHTHNITVNGGVDRATGARNKLILQECAGQGRRGPTQPPPFIVSRLQHFLVFRMAHCSTCVDIKGKENLDGKYVAYPGEQTSLTIVFTYCMTLLWLCNDISL